MLVLEKASSIAWFQEGLKTNDLNPIIYYLKILSLTLFGEGSPHLEGFYILKTILISISSSLLITSIFRTSSYTGQPIFNLFPAIINLEDGLPLKREIEGFQKSIFDKGVSIFQASTFLILIPILLSLGFLVVFIKDAELFYLLVQEDQIIENLSALFYFIACLCFLYLITQVSRSKGFTYKGYFILFSGIMAFGLFFMCMEEISWFQRVLEVETPEGFEGNLQNEMNLHNFATDKLEVIYYFLSFFFFIFLPFLYRHTQLFPQSSIFSFYIPSSLVSIFAIIFVVYNYDMWNQTLTQLCFITSLGILITYFIAYKNETAKALLFAFIALVCLITQLIFLYSGGDFVRLHDVTEYKEFFIPLAFTLYSLELLLKMKRIRTA